MFHERISKIGKVYFRQSFRTADCAIYLKLFVGFLVLLFGVGFTQPSYADECRDLFSEVSARNNHPDLRVEIRNWHSLPEGRRNHLLFRENKLQKDFLESLGVVLEPTRIGFPSFTHLAIRYNQLIEAKAGGQDLYVIRAAKVYVNEHGRLEFVAAGTPPRAGLEPISEYIEIDGQSRDQDKGPRTYRRKTEVEKETRAHSEILSNFDYLTAISQGFFPMPTYVNGTANYGGKHHIPTILHELGHLGGFYDFPRGMHRFVHSARHIVNEGPHGAHYARYIFEFNELSEYFRPGTYESFRSTVKQVTGVELSTTSRPNLESFRNWLVNDIPIRKVMELGSKLLDLSDQTYIPFGGVLRTHDWYLHNDLGEFYAFRYDHLRIQRAVSDSLERIPNARALRNIRPSDINAIVDAVAALMNSFSSKRDLTSPAPVLRYE